MPKNHLPMKLLLIIYLLMKLIYSSIFLKAKNGYATQSLELIHLNVTEIYQIMIIVWAFAVLKYAKKCCLVAQSCLCNPMDCSLPVSSVHEISQARILEQVAISFPTQRLNLLLLHWQGDSLPLSHQGSPYKSIVVLK